MDTARSRIPSGPAGADESEARDADARTRAAGRRRSRARRRRTRSARAGRRPSRPPASPATAARIASLSSTAVVARRHGRRRGAPPHRRGALDAAAPGAHAATERVAAQGGGAARRRAALHRDGVAVGALEKDAAHLSGPGAAAVVAAVRRLTDGSAPPAPPSPLAGTASLDDDGLGVSHRRAPSHHPHAPTANPWLSPTWLPGTPPGGAGRAVSRGARSVSAVSDEVEEDIDEALYDELAMIAPSRGSSRQYGYASAPYGSPGYSPPLMDSGEPSMDPSMDTCRVATPAEPLPPAERAERAAGVDENGGARLAAAGGVLSMHTAPASLLRLAENSPAPSRPSAAPTPSRPPRSHDRYARAAGSAPPPQLRRPPK